MNTRRILYGLATLAVIPFLWKGLDYASQLEVDESRFDTVLAARLQLEARPAPDGRMKLSWALSDFSAEIEKYEYQKGLLGRSYEAWIPISVQEEQHMIISDLTLKDPLILSRKS